MTATAQPDVAQRVGEEPVVIGDCLGRYTVQARLGAGAMGEVFEAHDPELDRRVALKVLKVGLGGTSPEARARFQREAQAMARLNDPNVVSVYDVDTVGERLFVAMELVHGPTLASWIAEGPHPWRRVVDVFLQAGRGLASAHEAGIIHRDFKPSNVILGDRVRVADFGLARAIGSGEADAAPPTTMLASVVTHTGQAVGTPAYMAPERLAGGPATAASDQYSFGVALHEALHGHRPGEPGVTAPVPAWLTRIELRARAAAPGDRYPSMRELLKALSRDRTRVAHWLPIGAGSLALVGAAAWVVARPAAEDPCAGSAARLAGVWDAPRRDAAHAAFVASKLPIADDAWRGASARVDAYAGRWVDMHTQACRATRVEGSQSDTLMDLRMACLERARDVLGALTSLWARGMDTPSMAAAIDAAENLPPLAECADARALSERVPLPSDRGRVAQIALVRSQLDGVQGLLLANRWDAARTALAGVRRAADATEWLEVRAEAAFLHGVVIDQLQDPEAQKPLLEAAGLAAAARNDLLAAQALVTLVEHLANHHNNPGEALLAADIADAAVRRAGDQEELRIRYLVTRGTALMIAGKLDDAWTALVSARDRATRTFGATSGVILKALGTLARVASGHGKFAEARRLAEEELEAATARFGPDDLRVADVLHNLGIYVDEDTGDHDIAAAYLRRALAIKEKASRPDAPTTALTLHALGVVELVRGENLEEAARLLDRTLAIQERELGPEHKSVGLTLSNQGIVRRKLGQFTEALAALSRALVITTTAYGSQHAAMAPPLSSIADTYEARGQDAAALDVAQRALAIRKAVVGADYPETVESTNQVARLLARLGRCGAARDMLASAAAALARAGDTDGPNVAMGLAVGARCDLADGNAAPATVALGRAIAMADKRKAAPVVRGGFRALRARALWSAGKRDEALAAARMAEQELAGDADGARDLAALKSWLASR